DRDGRLLYVNRLAAELAGYDDPGAMLAASQAARLDRFELIDESGARFDPDELPGRRVLAGLPASPTLIGFPLPDGAERWSLLDARPAILADGTPVAVNTFHDVTSRIESERRVREREARVRELADQRRRAEDRLELVLRLMPVGVILVDARTGRV